MEKIEATQNVGPVVVIFVKVEKMYLFFLVFTVSAQGTEI